MGGGIETRHYRCHCVLNQLTFAQRQIAAQTDSVNLIPQSCRPHCSKTKLGATQTVDLRTDFKGNYLFTVQFFMKSALKKIQFLHEISNECSFKLDHYTWTTK